MALFESSIDLWRQELGMGLSAAGHFHEPDWFTSGKMPHMVSCPDANRQPHPQAVVTKLMHQTSGWSRTD